MKQTSTILNQYQGAPESFRGEIEAQIRFVEAVSSDVATVSNLIKTAFNKVADAAQSLRNNHKAA